MGSVPVLTVEQAEQLEGRVNLRLNKYIPHDPLAPPGKENFPQAAFLLLDDQEAFYGGAAGGGKSDALLMAALQYVDHPGYAALILRKTYQDLSLPGALMDRAEDWLTGTDAVWHGQTFTWEFPSGATLSFGYLATEKDKYRYQSAAFDYIAFDELTHFTETMYTYLFSRLRQADDARAPLRVRSASNPGGDGHEWVFKRFVRPRMDWMEGKGPRPVRVFIPARLEDNKHLGANYEQSLLELDPVTYAQLRKGDWTIRPEGNMFKSRWFPVIEPEHVPQSVMARVRVWDLAASAKKSAKDDPDYTAGARVAVTWQGVYLIEDILRFRDDPGGVERALAVTASQDGKACHIGIEKEPGASGKAMNWNYRSKTLKGYTVHDIPAAVDKVTRAQYASAQAKHGMVAMVRGHWNDAWLDEAVLFPNPAIHDDQVDAVCAAINFLSDFVGTPSGTIRDERHRGR